MKNSWKRLVAVCALTLTASFALTACGDDDKKSDKNNDSSSQASDRGGFTRANFTERVLTAQTEFGSARFEFTMNAEGLEMAGEGAIAVGEDPEDAAMMMVMDSPFGEMEYILVDGVMYMSMPGLTGDGTYMKMELDDAMGDEYSAVLNQVNPMAQFEMFEDAVLEFEQDGKPEKINGVKATPYRLVIDTEIMLEEMGEEASELLDGTTMPDTLEYVIYLGDDELPYRIVMDMMGVEMTMDYYDWGEDITIEAPSPDQVTEFGLDFGTDPGFDPDGLDLENLDLDGLDLEGLDLDGLIPTS